MKLTNLGVKNAPILDRAYKLSDGNGLYLLVSPTGNKTWRFKYRMGRKECAVGLGRYPHVGLSAARLAQDEARQLLLDGKDPAIERKRDKQGKLHAQDATFRKFADEWLADHTPLWSASNAKRVRNRLERDLYPAFGSMPIGAIESTDILRVLRKIEGRGAIETAKRVRTYIRAVFRRAKGERFVNQAMIMEIDDLADALKPARKGRRQPALTSAAELLELQLDVDRAKANLLIKFASRLLALTAVRIGVLRTALWSEFHGIDWANPDGACEKPIWRIPAERMKLEVEDKLNPGFAHDVPLSTQAVEVLRALRVLTGACPLLFPHRNDIRAPMTDCAVSGAYKRMAAGRYKGRMVPHGWRTAFSTIMNERAAELERDGDRAVIDMILAHVPEGMSASEWAYNRARYLKPRTALLQVWADIISEGLPAPITLFAQGAR
jgi:integrase